MIEPQRGWVPLDVVELWRYRDLLYYLTWREVSIRYKQTFLGITWAILQPLMTMIVFTVFLGKLAGVPSDNIPYPVFSYLGLLPWTYFANAVTRSGTSLVANSSLLTKVYFPRLLVPASGVLSALVDFALAFAVLVVLMAVYRVPVAPSVVLLLPLTLLVALAALGVGLLLAALNVRYRDIQHAMPFALQLWMFATPVVFPASIVPERLTTLRTLLVLNPMTGIIEAFRAAPLGRPIDLTALAVSALVTAALLVVGLWQFGRLERTFADVI